VATFALGAAVLLAGDIGAPWLKIPALRWMRMERVDFQAWSPRALITVERAAGGVAWMHTDGTWKRPSSRPKRPLTPTWGISPTSSTKSPRIAAPVLVIGAGGGHDIRGRSRRAD
jgi:hypothetical protein